MGERGYAFPVPTQRTKQGKKEEGRSRKEKLAVEEEKEEEARPEERRGRHESARRWRRKFTTRRPPELPTLPRRLRALFQVSFLASCVLALPRLPYQPVRYTYVTTLGTRSRALGVSRLRCYIPSAVTM